MKTTSCTELKQYAFDNAPRCGAKTKRRNGAPCMAPAVRGKQRCRIHGGSKGSGAKLGNVNALKHGFTTKQSKNIRKEIKKCLTFKVHDSPLS
ncbi:MAG: HGGxSTG domain-containing protein [Coxiellaceae bacterium]|nr:HGGxSTG domain-containing protein [Coxiellaceae bacterium]